MPRFPLLHPMSASPHGAPRVRHALIVCLCAGLFCFGQMVGAVQKRENIIRADAVVAGSFELVNRDGSRAAQLNTNALGESMLSFFDEKGALRLRVGFSPRGMSGLVAFDAKKKAKLGLVVNSADEVPSIELMSGSPIGTSIHMVINDTGPYLSIAKVGGGSIFMGLDAQAVPDLSLCAAESLPDIHLRSDKSGANVLLGKNGKVRTNWRVLANGTPALHERRGRKRQIDDVVRQVRQTGCLRDAGTGRQEVNRSV